MGKSMRKYTKGKGMKWKKGESSSSNPSTNTHREIAKQSFFQYKLAQERDVKTSTMTRDTSNNMEVDGDAKSNSSTLTADTFKSNISSWTQCSITSFSRLQSIWSTNSVLHREMLAILAAITEVIKEKNGKETETEYFAALMVTLESVESRESRTAVVSLLSLLIKRVPPNVLRKQCSQIMKPLVKLLSENVSTDNNALMRSILKCLTAVLRVLELSVWKESSTEYIYRTMLSLLNHHKPKVRKQCHNSICSVLKGSDLMTGSHPPTVHPMAVLTAEYCVQSLEDSRVSKDSSITLHILGLLKDILSDFPHGALKSTVEAIFRCLMLANPLVTAVGLKALNGLFGSRPPASRLDTELNSQLINALYDFQPIADDSQLVLPWLETVKQAHLNLFRLDQDALLHFPRLCSTCMKLFLSDNSEIRVAASGVVKELTSTCLAAVSVSSESYQKYLVQIQRFFLAVEGGLTYEYHSAWNYVIQCLAALYDACGVHGSNFLVKSLEKLADLRDSLQFPFKPDLDYAFGRAIRRVGAPKVLRSVPLKLNIAQTPMDLSRSWIIPLLRDHVQDTELECFVTFFLPLASQLRSKSAVLVAAGENAEAKGCDMLQAQIWSLLPGFCTRPTDLVQNFRNLAKILGQALDERPDLHLDVMSALRNLVSKNLENEVNRAEVSKYAKNYLPRLLQIYTVENPETANIRLAALETVKIYLKITSEDVILEVLEKVFEKLRANDTSGFLQHACVDIAAVLLPYCPEAKLEGVLDFCRKAWESTDHTLQKKGYRCLEELLLAEQITTKNYVTMNMSAIKTALIDGGKAVKTAGKAARLRCIYQIVKMLENYDKEFIKCAFPEIVLSTKEVSEKARQTAFELVKQIGLVMLQDSSKPEIENIAEYFELLLTGFAGSPEAISATLIAISHAVYEFKEKISAVMMDMLMDNMNVLLASNIREIVQNVFSFLKVVFSQFSDVEIGHYVPKLIQSISGMGEGFRRHFRTKIKELFTVLIRKFGYAMVIEMVPEDDHKLLSNIRKTEDRKKRQKKEKRDIKNDDQKSRTGGSIGGQSRPETIDDILEELASSDEEPDVVENKNRRSKVYIAEGDDEEIVDFMDPRASQKISSVQPGKNSKRTEASFETAADGRMIIPNEEQEDERDDASLSSKLSRLSFAKKGNKGQEVEGDEDDDSFKYTAGGSGIHRPLKFSKTEAKAKKTASGVEYRAKKAGGDMKLKGRPDPFAYIPLNVKSTNKRKRVKLSGQFSGIMKGARKGAAKGAKQKKRDRKPDL